MGPRPDVKVLRQNIRSKRSVGLLVLFSLRFNSLKSSAAVSFLQPGQKCDLIP